MTSSYSRVFVYWVVAGVALTGTFGCIYLITQQYNRLSFNDQQVVLAEDGATIFNRGGDPLTLVIRPSPPLDIRQSTESWIEVFDGEGKPLSSSALFGTDLPQPPVGLFNDASWRDLKKHTTAAGENETRVTWEAKDGSRYALVIVKAGADRYVLAGKNIKEAENRIDELGLKILTAYVFTVIGTLIALWFFATLRVL